MWPGSRRDTGWQIDRLTYSIVSRPNPAQNTWQPFCFCGNEAVLRDGSIVCETRKCDLAIPGVVGLEYYIEYVLNKVLDRPDGGAATLSRHYVPWLKPICKCKQVLKLCMFAGVKSGLFWYMMCQNDKCDVDRLRPYELRHKMNSFFERFPETKPAFVHILETGKNPGK